MAIRLHIPSNPVASANRAGGATPANFFFFIICIFFVKSETFHIQIQISLQPSAYFLCIISSIVRVLERIWKQVLICASKLKNEKKKKREREEEENTGIGMQQKGKNFLFFQAAFSNGGGCGLEMQVGPLGGYAGRSQLWPWANHLLPFTAISSSPRDLLALPLFFLKGRNHSFHLTHTVLTQ